MGKYSQTIITILKLMLRGELGSPRKLLIPLLVLSVLFVLSFTGAALTSLQNTVEGNPSSGSIFRVGIGGKELLIICGNISLFNVNYSVIRIENYSENNNLTCYNISKLIVCPSLCSNLGGRETSIIYGGKNSIINIIVTTYESIFGVLYYIILVMFLLSIGGISYGFSRSIKDVWVKLEYWFSQKIIFSTFSLILSMYVIVLSLSISTILFYSISLMLSLMFSTPYLRPLPDPTSIAISFMTTYIAVLIGLILGARPN